MKKSINQWTFDPNLPVTEVVRQVAAAGFEAIEPVMDETGYLRRDDDEATWRESGDAIRSAGLEVASLACGHFWTWNYTSPDEADRKKAREMTVALLERARWIGAPVVLVVPGCVGRRTEKSPRIRYAEALSLAKAALRDVSGVAEEHGVKIGIENVWNRFLLSPVEMREFIDRVNSAWVGAYLDVGNALNYGYPQDWIETLGARIVRVHMKDFKMDAGGKGACPLGDGDVDWPVVMTSLCRVGYDGPLTYEGLGEPADISVRLDRVMK